MIELKRLGDLPTNLDLLINASCDEGFNMLLRLKENWLNSSNTFSKNGEQLWAAFSNQELVGICGLNVDPYSNDNNTARLRHMYVLPKYRRKGIGRDLIDQILKTIDSRFSKIVLRSNSKFVGSDHFYESFGFKKTLEENPTHVLELPKR